MKLKNWGLYPFIDCDYFTFENRKRLLQFILKNKGYIPYGNGRSYGDSAISERLIYCKPYNQFLSFNEKEDILHCQSGVLLSEIINIFAPKGYFLKVVPGTKYITVGGAVAADIHGKNHHIEGCFSQSVLEFNLMLPNGKVVKCSRTENSELYKATCGGMGLTGIILDVKIKLMRISSLDIDQNIIKTKNLKETFDLFESLSNVPYSVAWIDCLTNDKNLGRSLLITGKFSENSNLNFKERTKISIPFYLPSNMLNKYSVKTFNWFYYNRIIRKQTKSTVSFDSFFFPLDSLKNWNKIYGRKGFTQYQFILPKKNSYDGLKEILKIISRSGQGTFLAVLKLYGKENQNYLSFPFEGYSLALDFKIQNGLFSLLNVIDKIVLKYEGRIYLAKDVRVTKEVFEKGYNNINKFRAIREKYGMRDYLYSNQSIRIDI